MVETQAALVETPAAPVETPAALVETPAAAVETEAAPVETPPSPVDASPSPVATPSTDGAAPPPAFIAPVGVDPEPPASVEAPADVVAPVAAAVGADATAPKPGPEAGTSAGEPVPPRWWVKYVMWLGTAIIVVIIVAIIRSNTPGSTPNPPVSPNSASSGASSTKPVQVSGTVLTQFTGISQTLDTANVAATKALANGSSQSVAQVATEVAPYLTALDTFNFDLHLMTWPTAMEVPSQELTLRTQSLASFLGSVLSANAASLSTWFTQFHALAQETQAADNVVRRDIGLPLTTNYP